MLFTECKKDESSQRWLQLLTCLLLILLNQPLRTVILCYETYRYQPGRSSDLTYLSLFSSKRMPCQFFHSIIDDTFSRNSMRSIVGRSLSSFFTNNVPSWSSYLEFIHVLYLNNLIRLKIHILVASHYFSRRDMPSHWVLVQLIAYIWTKST